MQTACIKIFKEEKKMQNNLPINLKKKMKFTWQMKCLTNLTNNLQKKKKKSIKNGNRSMVSN